jgi:hypothetical protein
MGATPARRGAPGVQQLGRYHEDYDPALDDPARILADELGDDSDDADVRAALAVVIARGWHLVRGEVLHVTSLVTGAEHDEIRVDEEWRS